MPNNLVTIVLDSCRFDSFQRAATPHIDKIGGTQSRWSYASWTAPSHYTLFMGMVPHQSPQNVYASEVYKNDFRTWVDRLDIPDLRFETFVPQLSLAKVLKDHGYRCSARVSMPVLNNFTVLNKHWDSYKLEMNHNNFAGMVDEITFSEDQPSFHFFNLGETHYPYMLKGDDLPRISGVHGVFKSLGKGEDAGVKVEDEGFFSDDEMRRLHEQQIHCVEYVDGLIGALIEKAPKNTYFMVMADHGEAFGENGYFGHGPVMHEVVFSVPFVEGMRP